MKMRRLCAYIMALLLVVSMPLTAFAVEADVSQGNVAINDTSVSHTKDGTERTDPHEGKVTVIQSNPSTPTNHNVSVNTSSGSSVNVTLKDVNIDVSGNSDKAAVEVTGSGNVTIELDGTNTVKSGDNHAGVEKNDGDSSGKLTITDDNETAGSLEAKGGKGGAGIGGGYESGASDITISGGTVTANGGENAAGIGGGEYGAGSNITISGGNVTANGGNVVIPQDADGFEAGGGAGIGGGANGSGSNITISGGTVMATGGEATIGNEVFSGGAGIGGGAYGEGNNITVKYNAQVTAEGKGNAADIGNGYASEATEKQKDKVDLNGLSSFGKVNGVSGGDGGFHASDGGGSSGGSFVSFFGSNSGSNSSSSPSYKSRLDVKATLGKITSTDNDDNALSNVVWLEEEGTLKVTAPADNVLVTGNKADLLQLKEDGVKKINLETNRVNVSVTNELLQKITGTGGFQLTADGTIVSLSSTAGNNQKNPGLKLTANQQPEKAKLQVDFLSEASMESAEDARESLNKTLKVSTNAPEATLSYDRKFLNALMNSEFGKLALAVGNLLATMENQLAAITAQNGSGSITIGDNSVIMDGFEFSTVDSSENNKLDDVLNEIKLKMENKAQGGSTMVVEVNAKAAMASASLKVPESALQSLIRQGVEETALSVNGETTRFKNVNLGKQIEDSQVEMFVEMVDVGGSQLPFVNFRTHTDIQ